MAQGGQQTPKTRKHGDRPDPRIDEGPPKINRSPEGASPKRQIAQEPQQSSGQGGGQS